jgi:hypothetical protein
VEGAPSRGPSRTRNPLPRLKKYTILMGAIPPRLKPAPWHPRLASHDSSSRTDVDRRLTLKWSFSLRKGHLERFSKSRRSFGNCFRLELDSSCADGLARPRLYTIRGSGEMANTLALGASAQKACGFKSRLPHQIRLTHRCSHLKERTTAVQLGGSFEDFRNAPSNRR